VGEKLLAFEHYSVIKQLYELLAKCLAFGVVGVPGLSSTFLVQECVFLAIHAQRENFGNVDLVPALRAHMRLCEVESVLFIGTQFSILYTSMYSPAETATPRA
jgi:hypothetical protein